MKSVLFFLLLTSALCSDAQHARAQHIFPWRNNQAKRDTFWFDGDRDGYGNDSLFTLAKTTPVGYVSNHTDCNDNNANVHPGATEICDSLDDDCDGLVDEGLTTYLYYVDANGDGFGDSPADTVRTCSATAPAGYADTLAPLTDFMMASTSQPVNRKLWKVTLEKTQNNGTRYFDINTEPFESNCDSLGWATYNFGGGVPALDYLFVFGAVTPGMKTGNGGYDCNAKNTSSNCYTSYAADFWPSAVSFVSSRHANLSVTINVQHYNSLNNINALNWANTYCPIDELILGQETNKSYNNCVFCGNGTSYKNTVAPIATDLFTNFPSPQFTMDADQIRRSNYTSSFNNAIVGMSTFTAVRDYLPFIQLCVTPPQQNWSAQVMKDSLDFAATTSMSNDVHWMNAFFHLPVSITEWGFGPNDGLPIAGTFLDAHEGMLYKMHEIDLDYAEDDLIASSMYWNLGDVHPETTAYTSSLGSNYPIETNYVYDELKMVGHYFTEGNHYSIAITPCDNAIGSVDPITHHGWIIIDNPTGNTYPISYVSVDGYLLPVTRMEVLQGNSLGDNAMQYSVRIMAPFTISPYTETAAKF